MVKRNLYVLTLLLGCSLWAHTGRAQVTNYKAYSLFLYSFSKYVNWPDEVTGGDFIISVVGKSKVVDELRLMAEKKNMGGRKIIIKEVDQPEDLSYSHIVFLSDHKSAMLDEIFGKTKGDPVLIVTERDGLIRKGACISFIAMEDNSLRFEVNEENMSGRQLKVAKSLLALAHKE